jgi:hypothetical protein
MDSQVQNLNQFAELVSADVIERLRLGSSDTILKMVSAELSKLAKTATNLTKSITGLDSTLKSSLAFFNNSQIANVSQKESSSPLSTAIERPEISAQVTTPFAETKAAPKEDSKKPLFESFLEKALDFVSSPKTGEYKETDKGVLEKAIQKTLDIVSSSKSKEVVKEQEPRGSVLESVQETTFIPREIAREGILESTQEPAPIPREITREGILESTQEPAPIPTQITREEPRKSILEGTLEKALDFVSSPKTGEYKEADKGFLEKAIQKTLDIVSSSKSKEISGSTENVSSSPSSASVQAESAEKGESKSILQDTLQKIADYIGKDKPKEESAPTESSTQEKPGLIKTILDKVTYISKVSETSQITAAGNSEPKSELKAIEKPKEVIISGIGEQALRGFAFPSFLERFKDLSKLLQGVKDGVNKVGSNIKELSNSKGGLLDSLFNNGPLKALLPILGGAALVLGGIASLVTAFTTDSGIKGTLETVGKLGIRGGLTILAKNIAKLGTKFLTKIPVIGSLISFGFALQRFSNGDIIGGILDVGSGIASLFPGVGTVVSIGIDVLQAILDAKGGGSSKEASAKKGDVLLGWAKSIGGFLEDKIQYIPVIGPLYATGKALLKGEWKKALIEFATVIPGLQLVKILMGDEKYTAAASQGLTSLGNWFAGIGNLIDEKIKYLPILGPLYGTGKALMKGEWKNALSEFINVVPGMSWVRSLLGDENIVAAVEGAATGIGDFLKGVGELIDEKIKYIPVLGPLYYTGKSLLKGDFKRALFEFTTLFPPLQFVRAFMTEPEMTQASENLSVSVKDWFKGVGDFIDEKIKYIPILGPLYYTGKALLSGDWKKAFFELATILPPLHVMRAFMTEEQYEESVSGTIANVKGWVSSVQKWIFEKVKGLPIIGPIIETITSAINDPVAFVESLPGGKAIMDLFASDKKSEGMFKLVGSILGKVTDWVFAKVKELPVIGPLINMVSSAINDPTAFIEGLPGGKAVVSFFKFITSGKVMETAFQFTGNILGNIADWAFDQVKDIPVIGPLLKTIRAAVNDPVAFIESLPGGKSIVSFFKFITSGKVTDTAIQFTGDILGKVTDWVSEKITELPVIGPLIKGIKLAINDPIEFLKCLPGGSAIIGFIEGARNLASSAIDTVGNFASSLTEKVKNLFTSLMDSILNGFLNLIPETVSVFGVEIDLRKRVKSFLGMGSKESSSPSSSPAPSSGDSPSDSSVKQVQDSVIDPKGGLVVSSPEVGALFQLNKKDGIVSGPMMEGNREGITSSDQENGKSASVLSNLLVNNSSNNKSDSILERIANNTALSNQNISNLIAGFNNLAKALEKTLGDQASIPMVVNATSNQEAPQRPTSSQYASAGNSDIANFRTTFIEGARFRPA